MLKGAAWLEVEDRKTYNYGPVLPNLTLPSKVKAQILLSGGLRFLDNTIFMMLI